MSSPASAMPAAWAIRPQFGSRPSSAVLTSGELAIARATRSASSSSAAPVDLDPADPGRALAVGDDLERELQQDRVEQALGQRPPGGAARLEQDGVVGAHLAVDRDPLEGAVDGPRAARRRRRRPPRRSGRSRAWSRSRARSSRRPWPGRRGDAVERRSVQRFGQRSVVMIASEKSAAAVGGEAAARRVDPAEHASRSSSGTPITPVSATATVPARGRAAAAAVAHRAARRRMPCSPVAALALPELTTHGADPPWSQLRRGRPGSAPRRRRCGSGGAPR